MAKMGRPISENPKNHKITIRIDQEEYEKLQAWAENHGMTQTQALRVALQDLLMKD